VIHLAEEDSVKVGKSLFPTVDLQTCALVLSECLWEYLLPAIIILPCEWLIWLSRLLGAMHPQHELQRCCEVLMCVPATAEHPTTCNAACRRYNTQSCLTWSGAGQVGAHTTMLCDLIVYLHLHGANTVARNTEMVITRVLWQSIAKADASWLAWALIIVGTVLLCWSDLWTIVADTRRLRTCGRLYLRSCCIMEGSAIYLQSPSLSSRAVLLMRLLLALKFQGAASQDGPRSPMLKEQGLSWAHYHSMRWARQ
jgi:hypothetical protein